MGLLTGRKENKGGLWQLLLIYFLYLKFVLLNLDDSNTI